MTLEPRFVAWVHTKNGSEFEGCNEPSPVRFVAWVHTKNGSVGRRRSIFFSSVTWYRGPGFDS